MTNFPNPKPYLGKKSLTKIPRPNITKTKAEIISEMTEIIRSARKIREEYTETSRPDVAV